jgi:hypothetical protein
VFEYDASGRYEVPFVTDEGRPTKVFIYIDHESKSGDVYDDYKPCVGGLELLVLNQSIKSISDLDEFEVYDATRRNSALRCELSELRKKTGGALLSLDDFCDWTDFTVFDPRDTFKGSFVITESNVVKLDTRVVDELAAAERTLLNALPRRVNVLFIYEMHCLKGAAGTLRFWRKPESYAMEQRLAGQPRGGYSMMY